MLKLPLSLSTCRERGGIKDLSIDQNGWKSMKVGRSNRTEYIKYIHKIHESRVTIDIFEKDT